MKTLLPSTNPISTLDVEVIKRLAAIVASSEDAIIGKDADGVITSWNPAAEKIFGYTEQEAIGQSIEILVPPERIQEESLIFQKILKGGQVSHFETERICKDGRHIFISATVSPIYDSNGKLIGSSKIARDITGQIEAEMALVNANKELAYQAQEKVKRAAELLVINEKLHQSLMETIELARKMTELRDPYTAEHEKNVGDLARAIAEELGFSKLRQEGLKIAGYLHDIGKMIVPTEILSKPTKLSPEEYGLVKNHVQEGFKLLKELAFLWPIAQPVLEHHERLDGSGYPYGLKDHQISIEGRILAVADTVDAMSSRRPYRAGLGIQCALAEIVRGRGTQYDETVVDACLKLFREKGYVIPNAMA